MREFHVKGRYVMVRRLKANTSTGALSDKTRTVELGFARFVKAGSAEEARDKVIDAIRKKVWSGDRYSVCENLTFNDIAVYGREI